MTIEEVQLAIVSDKTESILSTQAQINDPYLDKVAGIPV
jgi:hypothetical protein